MSGKSKLFDPAKISNKYSVLAAFLIAMEALLGGWLFLADTRQERIWTGVLMTLIFLAFLAAITYIAASDRAPAPAPGVDRVARERVTEQEIEEAPNEVRAGPDGTYLINEPPDGWSVQQLSYGEWVGLTSGIDDPQVLQALLNGIPAGARIVSDFEARRVLLLKSPVTRSVIPVPGTTRVNGRLVPTALEAPAPTQLSIIPMDRAAPPFYAERPMLHNFLNALGVAVRTGAVLADRLQVGSRPGEKYEYATAEMGQLVEGAIVDGKEGQDVRVRVDAIGVEGDLGDYLLLLNYTTDAREGRDGDGPPEVRALKELANSFRPMALADPERRRKELEEQADEAFRGVIAEKGEQIFYVEISAALLRSLGWDLDDSDQRSRTIKMLRPFQALAGIVGIDDEHFNELWESLDDAEAGDATRFKEILAEARGAIRQQAQEREGGLAEPAVPPALPGGAEPAEEA